MEKENPRTSLKFRDLHRFAFLKSGAAAEQYGFLLVIKIQKEQLHIPYPQHGHREHAHAHSRRIIRRDMVCAQEVRIGTPVALRLLPALREDQAEGPVQIALPYRNQLLVYLYPPVLYLGYLVQGYYERAVYPDEILRE